MEHVTFSELIRVASEEGIITRATMHNQTLDCEFTTAFGNILSSYERQGNDIPLAVSHAIMAFLSDRPTIRKDLCCMAVLIILYTATKHRMTLERYIAAKPQIFGFLKKFRPFVSRTL